MSAIDIVRQYFPDATEDDADYILWNQTCFPFIVSSDVDESIDHWKLQIAKYKCTVELLCGGPFRTGEEMQEEVVMGEESERAER